MSTHNRKELLESAQYEGKRTGNLNVLLTNAVSQHIGLSATEYECYSLLLDQGPMTAGKLASLCGISSGGLTGLVDWLEKLGFVARAFDPADRRRVLVSAKPNKKIEEKVWFLIKPMLDGFDAMSKNYSDEQLALLVRHYKGVNQVMEETIAQLSVKK